MAEVDIELKYATLTDPETCPIEELQKQVKDLETMVGFFDTKQLAIKKFINSVYGALGSKYFVAHNVYMAESITAQGRDLNHYSENSVNSYFKGIFQSNPEVILHYQWVHYDENGTKYTFGSKDKPADYYKTGKWTECEDWEPAVKKGKKLGPEDKACLSDNLVGQCDWFMTKTTLAKKLNIDPERMKTFDISKGKTTETGELVGPDYDYLEGNQSLTISGDTDSSDASTLLEINKKNEQIVTKIRDFFTDCKLENLDTVLVTPNGSEVVPVKNTTTKTFDPVLDKVVWRPINYVMRHRVKKSRYKIITDSGKEIIVTGDHSCMVIRDNALISIKAKDIINSDKIITICQD